MIISTLNFLMFLQLRILWKQKRELKKTIRSSSVFTLPTPINSKQVQKDSICSASIFMEEKYKINESENGDAQKEVKMTLLLLSFVATYVILTVPCNITLIYWTLYPEVYVSWMIYLVHYIAYIILNLYILSLEIAESKFLLIFCRFQCKTSTGLCSAERRIC